MKTLARSERASGAIETTNQQGNRPMCATETMMSQIATIDAAIEALKAKIDAVTGSVDPDEANWRDVARLAQAAEAAREVLDRLQAN